MILDTSFLIDVLRGNDAVTEWESRLDDRGRGAITAITVMELWEGIHRVDASETERQRVHALVEGLTEAAFDRQSAVIAAELSARLASEGRNIEIEDIMIAAIALSRDEPVLTGNPDHFERIDELTVESY